MRAAHLSSALLLVLAWPALATEPVQSVSVSEKVDAADSFGEALSPSTLESLRGGDQDIVENVIHITGEVTDNSATNVATGHNSINEGSFASASGLTTVVQNTGANVLIQSATIVNIQFVDP
jgi:hypothetical protein